LIPVDAEEAVMSQALDPLTHRHVDNLARALVREFAGVFSEETTQRSISESVELLGDSRITAYVPVVAHRYPGKRCEDWELDDPAGQDLATVRRIRDELDLRVQALVRELLPGVPTAAG
jgi:hypothetical protein